MGPEQMKGSSGRRPRPALAAVLVAALVVVVACGGSGSPTSGSGWHLIWSDGFSGTSLSGRWNAERVASPRNHELEYYVPQNASVGDGDLTLTSQRQSYQGFGYTSAAVDTYRKFSFTYGKVVIRAKLPQMGQGIWPALWMLGTGCNPVGQPCPWPTRTADEIDLIEAVNSPSKIFMTPHYGPYVGDDIGPGSCTYNGTDLSSSFHTYTVLWAPGGHLTWYIDGQVRCQRTATGYFRGPMYLIMNTAIGGSFPGSPASSTAFPQQFKIDSVRVYQSGRASS